MTATALPLIPATVVGSHGRPAWWCVGVKAWEAGEMGPADLDETPDDAADPAIREMARLFNRATEGVRAKLGFHICFGNRFGRSRFDRSYRPYLPGLLDARADQFVIELAGREMAELDLWGQYAGEGRELGAGVIDVKGFYPETAEDVAERIRRVLK